jgi:hypothetical protein
MREKGKRKERRKGRGKREGGEMEGRGGKGEDRGGRGSHRFSLWPKGLLAGFPGFLSFC